jgi:hypothetical protein
MTSDARVRSQLSELPSPGMPHDVYSAISARIAEEAAQPGGRPGEPTADNVVAFTPRHSRRLNGLLLAAAVAAFALLMAISVEPASPPIAAGQPPVVRAGAIYEPRAFAEQVRQRYLTAPTAVSPTATFADSQAGIEMCADAVDAVGPVLAVDAGSYDEVAAVVMVTTYPANSQYEEVWVVLPACGPGNNQVIRHMLYDVDNSAANL